MARINVLLVAAMVLATGSACLVLEGMAQQPGPAKESPLGQPSAAAPTRPADAKASGGTTIPAKLEEEKKILAVLEEMRRSESRGMMNVPAEDGRLLRVLAETMGAKKVVEIGTSNGYSGIWICLGLRQTGGKLITHEIDTDRAALARKNFKRAGVEEIATVVEGDAHKEVSKLEGPIDIVFLDADKSGYADYLKQLLPLLRPGGLVLAHNTTDARSELKDYLQAITTNPELETVIVNAQSRGISITMKKR